MISSNDSPLVSILTPCFNSAEYLQRCLDSVAAQDYPRVEHIIQDGASTDGTWHILEGCAGRVDWVSEPDAGQSDALNKALQRCRGEIILVLNADDELLPHAASWAVTQLNAYPEAAAVYGDQYYIGPEGEIAHEAPQRPPYDFARVFCVEDVPPAQAMFIRRSALEAVGWSVDVTRKTCPDYEMLVRLGLKFPLCYVPGFVARYRVHPGSQGCQPQWVDAMVASKREVMERVFHNPETPASVRWLRRRALGGLLWWSADVFLGQGDVGRGLRRAAQSLWVCPAGRQWRKVPGFLRISLLVAARQLRRKASAARRGRTAPC